jgi:hypothetical protein
MLDVATLVLVFMKIMKWFGLVTGLVLGATAALAQVAGTPAAGPVSATAPATLSPGAAEVVRLATSGVTDDVVLAFIQNSQAPFTLSANDVLYLKDLGLSPQVTSAMISHDSTLRGQAQAYAPAPSGPAPAAAVPPPSPVMAPTAAPAATVAAAPAPVYVSSPPADVSYFYNDLAPYGTWVQLDGVGWCWQPTAVAVTPGWRPYCDGGSWVYSDLGWYWQSTYTWGWAPFHYGRWQHHPHCGWVWAPDRTWGPAWVTWRTAGKTCGWAPLPPHATFDLRLGWCYNGVTVGAGFGFNLGSDSYLFVSLGNVCQHNVRSCCLPPAQVNTIYRQTTIVNNYAVVNNTMVHRGIPVDRVAAVSHGSVPRATVREWSAAPGRIPVQSGNVVYRPHLAAPAQPVHMQAQKIDTQHPVIQHAAFIPAHGAAPASSGRGYQAPAASSTWSTPATHGAQPGQAPTATPSARSPQAPVATHPATAVGTKPAATTPQAAPSGSSSTRWSQPKEDWKQGIRPSPGYRENVNPSPVHSTPQGSQPATPSNPHVYYPKTYHQNAEIKTLTPDDAPTTPSQGGGNPGSHGHK